MRLKTRCLIRSNRTSIAGCSRVTHRTAMQVASRIVLRASLPEKLSAAESEAPAHKCYLSYNAALHDQVDLVRLAQTSLLLHAKHYLKQSSIAQQRFETDTSVRLTSFHIKTCRGLSTCVDMLQPEASGHDPPKHCLLQLKSVWCVASALSIDTGLVSQAYDTSLQPAAPGL